MTEVNKSALKPGWYLLKNPYLPRGVHTSKSKFVASIFFKKTKYFLGTFKTIEEAREKYLEKAKYIGAKALDALAGDMHAEDNLKDANRAYRGLSEEQKAYVAERTKELEKYTRRGSAYAKKQNKEVNLENINRGLQRYAPKIVSVYTALF
jgi:hypothetical protein